MNKMTNACYKRVYRMDIPGDAHSRCNNFQAIVEANPHGIKNGWFMWPLNFDPTWLITCNGYSENESDKLPYQELDPIAELLALLR